jgi:hypothetical protein
MFFSERHDSFARQVRNVSNLGAGFIFLKIWLRAGCDPVFCFLQAAGDKVGTLIKTSGCLIPRALNLAQQDIQTGWG